MLSDLFTVIPPLLALVLGLALSHVWHTRRKQAARAWPQDFQLLARPMFSTEERLLYRELKAALPHHVVLAKVNLLRFCQSASESQARLWFERLQALNVTFAICSPNGTVVSVIDLEPLGKQATSERQQRLKEAVLNACRIRQVRCTHGQWPKPALLAAWALGGGVGGGFDASGESRPATPLNQARAELAQKLQRRRIERASRFQDSVFATDSFFAMDSRFEMAANSSPAPLDAIAPAGAPSRTVSGSSR
jgi:Protein of unknown function (DUF2726)